MDTTGWSSPMYKGDPIPALKLPAAADQTNVCLFDFGGTYPVGEVVYAGGEAAPLQIEYSLDGHIWTDKKTARFAKVSAEPDSSVDWNAVRFHAGEGFAAEPADDWTVLFHGKRDWSGADGIYSIAFNGVEKHGTASSTKTLFLFGDTFIGEVDEATDARPDTAMINNTLAVLDGAEPKPEAIRFIWNSAPDGTPASAFTPTTPKGAAVEGSYYWLQDGIAVDGTFYCFPLIVGPDPNGPEGFQFAVHGITRVSAPLGENGPLLGKQEQADTDLHYTADNGRTTYFGAAMMANTVAAGASSPDGYIYIYGLQNGAGPQPVVARVLEQSFQSLEHWRYWNGSEWCDRKEQAVPIADEVSCEYSVTGMSGQWQGPAYAMVYQQGTTDNMLSIAFSDSPAGPFGDPIRLYYCAEPEEGNGIYTYNAKAHPHLSGRGELLASYNVNTTSMDVHMSHAGVYRPRFVRIRQIL